MTQPDNKPQIDELLFCIQKVIILTSVPNSSTTVAAEQISHSSQGRTECELCYRLIIEVYRL